MSRVFVEFYLFCIYFTNSEHTFHRNVARGATLQRNVSNTVVTLLSLWLHILKYPILMLHLEYSYIFNAL